MKLKEFIKRNGTINKLKDKKGEAISVDNAELCNEELTAYKLVRIKSDGNYYPLFIDKKTAFVFNEWKEAECIKSVGFAVRKGYHCTFYPVAPHLNEKLKSGEQRVWLEVKVKNWCAYDRPESQGGAWILAKEIMPIRALTHDEVEAIRTERLAV